MKKVLVVDDINGWREFNSKVIYELLGSDTQIDKSESATDAYTKLLENNDSPYDIIITDLQMEDDYAPKYAGEWLVEKIKMLPKYFNTKVIMISASYNIRHIADSLNIFCIPKSTATKCLSAYKEILFSE